MDCVIEIQGFFDKDDEFVPKEVAVVTLDEEFSGHWIISPPVLFTDLPQQIRIKNNWLTHNHHGIEWFEGDITLQQLHIKLRDIARGSGKIYAFGPINAGYLQAVMSREIVNLETVNCPTFSTLAFNSQRCLHHGLMRRPELTCSLNRAVRLKQWILEDVPPTSLYYPAEQTTSTEAVLGDNSHTIPLTDEHDPDWSGLARTPARRLTRSIRCGSYSDPPCETIGVDC